MYQVPFRPGDVFLIEQTELSNEKKAYHAIPDNISIFFSEADSIY
jgi:hypothetical protein